MRTCVFACRLRKPLKSVVTLSSTYNEALTFENLCRKVERYPPPPPLVSLRIGSDCLEICALLLLSSKVISKVSSKACIRVSCKVSIKVSSKGVVK